MSHSTNDKLHELLDLFRDRLTPEAVEQIEEFIWVGEPTLAIEWLAEEITELNEPVSEAVFSTIREVATGLAAHPSFWEHIRCKPADTLGAPSMSKPEINAPAAELLFELIDGPADPKLTWVVSNEPNSGVLGTLDQFTPEQASRPPALGRRTPAAHAAHLLFSLELANRRLHGENPDAADWDGSWEPSVVGAADWDRLSQQIREASAALRKTVEAGADWEPLAFKGIIATVGHVAYHLGAIRQLVPARHADSR